MKITHFDVLRGPFVDRDQASRRVPKIKQNVAKMHQKSSRNEHGKMWIPMLQLSKTHAVDRPLKMHKIAFIFCRSRYCFAHAMDAKILQKRQKFIKKWSQKIRSPVLQWSNTRVVGRRAKMHKKAFISIVPGKSSKIIDGDMHCVCGRARREAGQFGVYFSI